MIVKSISYCEIIYIRLTFNSVCFAGNLRNTYSHYGNIGYNLKSINSSVQKHVQCRQTTEFRARKIKGFHSVLLFKK